MPKPSSQRESQHWQTGGNPNTGRPEGIPTLADRRESQHWQTGGNPNTGRPEGIPTLADRRESQHWQTGGRHYAEFYLRTCKNIITSCIIFCLQSRNLHTQPEVTARTLCLDAELIDLRIVLYHMDFTTGSRPDHDFILFYNLLLF